MLLPFVLGSSPHLPVSVCGTGTSIQFSQAFLVSVILDTSLLLFHYIFRYESFLFLAYLPLLRPLRFLSISVVQESYTCSPSATLLSLTLGPDLPWADEPSPGNLRLSTAWILTMLSLLIPAFSLLSRPYILSVILLPTIECSSTTDKYLIIYIFLQYTLLDTHQFAISVYSLAPVIFRANSLDQ